MTRKDLKQEFTRLSDNRNFPNAAAKRNRGRLFENLIHSLLEFEGLSPSPNPSFRPPGEEIDGSFVLGHKVFLFEAKWHKNPMPASSIYQFKGKVDGKLIGTIGIYISMSGFSGEAVDALVYGKSINILLFDKDDFATCIEEPDGFKKVMLQKIREATEKGTAFYKVTSLSVTSTPTPTKAKVSISQSNTSNFLIAKTRKVSKYDLIFIVEGNSDQRIIASFAEKIFRMTNKRKEINIMVAGGKYSVAILANSMQGSVDNSTKLVVVADSDDDKEETLDIMTKNLNNKNSVVIIPEPEIEIWFKSSKITSRKELRDFASRNRSGKTDEFVSELVEKTDIELLIRNDASFRQLYEVLSE